MPLLSTTVWSLLATGALLSATAIHMMAIPITQGVLSPPGGENDNLLPRLVAGAHSNLYGTHGYPGPVAHSSSQSTLHGNVALLENKLSLGGAQSSAPAPISGNSLPLLAFSPLR